MRIFRSTNRDQLVTTRRLATLAFVLLALIVVVRWGALLTGPASKPQVQPMPERPVPGQDTFKVWTHFSPETQRALELDIREALFHHLFQRHASAAEPSTAYYFLAFGDIHSSRREDPPPAFLARFEGHVPPVAPFSKATTDSTIGNRAVHREGGGAGLIFFAGRVRWLNASTVELTGSYYQANLSAAGTTYRVRRRGGEWVVEVAPGAARWIS